MFLGSFKISSQCDTPISFMLWIFDGVVQTAQKLFSGKCNYHQTMQIDVKSRFDILVHRREKLITRNSRVTGGEEIVGGKGITMQNKIG